MTTSAAVTRLIEETLAAHELDFSHHDGGVGGRPGIVVALPGERRLITNTLLSVGEHGVRLEAFVCRQPDENFEGVYKYLLRRNRRLYGMAYTLDNIGDIYLVGRMSLHAVTADEIDRLLGQVPYAWERAGLSPVDKVTITALGRAPIPCRALPVGMGSQAWADYTVGSPRGNLRGMFLTAQLDLVHAELCDFGHKEAL